MLTVEQNETLTKVGPGTPMGELMRRYWHPVATEFEMRDEPTKRVRLLGESLTLYREPNGGYGLIAERCPHRLVNLATGMVEDGGLRCIYHGWKFDETGACTEQPAEPAGSDFKDKVKITAYPVQPLAGLVWAYLGPSPVPLLPRWDLFAWDGVFRQIGTTVIPANWLQCQENSADSWHAHFTHGWYAQYLMDRMQARGIPVSPHQRRVAASFRDNPDARHSYERYKYGMLKRRMRVGESEEAHGWKVGHPMVFPNYVRIGKKGWYAFQMRIPMDDTHTWHVHYEVVTPGSDVQVAPQDPVPAFDVPLTDMPDFILGQDFVAWAEQGPIMDRSQEMLSVSDEGVILFRKQLLEQIEVVRDGGDPINTFRDPAENECIVLPTEGFGDFEDYIEGSARHYDTGRYGYVDEMDLLLRQAKQAALAKKG